MAHLGRQAARALLDRDPGDPDGHTGWTGALQDAATISGHDPGVLTIADEIHQAAHDLSSPAALRAYATSTLLVVSAGPGAWVLRGILEHVDVTAK